jgi:hypothetical protein
MNEIYLNESRIIRFRVQPVLKPEDPEGRGFRKGGNFAVRRNEENLEENQKFFVIETNISLIKLKRLELTRFN